jgi:hypothetical protein
MNWDGREGDLDEGCVSCSQDMRPAFHVGNTDPPLHQLASVKSPLVRRRTTNQDICTGSGVAGRGRAGARHRSVPMYTEWA